MKGWGRLKPLTAVLVAALVVLQVAPMGGAFAQSPPPSHFVAGYGVDTSSTVDLAASEGVQVAHPFPTVQQLAASSPSVLDEMAAKNMHIVSDDLLQDVNNYGCWHEWTFVGQSTDFCAGVPTAYTNFGKDAAGLQGARNTLLSAVTSDLNAVMSSPHANLVSYFTILEKWPSDDAGSVQQVLPAVTALIHQIAPGRQSICSFQFQHLVPLSNYGGYSSADGWPLENFSPAGCDDVAVYGYAQLGSNNPEPFTAADYDWTMSKVLPPWINALVAVGSAADPSWNKQVNLIGVGQVFGQDSTSSGAFVPPLLDSATALQRGVPVYQPIVDQETAFCREGASIMPFAWNLNPTAYPGLQTPVNNPSIDAGIKAAAADCQAIWQGPTSTTLSSSSTGPRGAS